MASRREVIKAIGASAAALPTIGDATALAQGTVSSPTDAATAAFLAQFAAAWRPLDPQLRFVLRLIYARLQGLPPPSQLSPAELRRINASLSFYFNAGGPPLPHIEETTIDVPSGRTKVRLYDPGTPAPAPTVVLIHGGGWVFGSLDTYDGFARQIAKRSGLRCLSIEYALAPEHPFPAPLDDCIAAVRWAATEGSSIRHRSPAHRRHRGFVGRQSRARGLPRAARRRHSDRARGGAALRRLFARPRYAVGARLWRRTLLPRRRRHGAIRQRLLADQADRQNPLAVPMLADLAELPPLYVAACEFDPLHDRFRTSGRPRQGRRRRRASNAPGRAWCTPPSA